MGLFDFFKSNTNKIDESKSDSRYFLDAYKLWDLRIGGYSNPSEAIKLLNKAISLNQKDDTYYSHRGLANAQLQKYDLSIQDYTTAINLNPGSIFYLVSRGRAFAAIKKYQNALDDFNKAIKLDSRDPSGYINRAIIYWDLGEYMRTIEDFTQLIALDSNNCEYYFCRGWYYGALKKYENAIEDYRKAILIDPEYAKVLQELAKAYFLSGNRIAALETVQKLRHLDSARADNLYNEIMKY